MKRIWILFCLLTGLFTLSAQELWRPPSKKLLHYGWDAPSVAFLHRNIRAMEAGSPFNGVCIKLNEIYRDSQNKEHRLNEYTFNPQTRWKYEWLLETEQKLRNTEFRQFTDNLLSAGFRERISWTDDKGWETLIENFRLLARLARRSGLKGLAIDIEQYWRGKEQFQYKPDLDGESYEKTQQEARRRGREFMNALGAEYPDITLFFTYFFSVNFASVRQQNNPPAVLASSPYDKYNLFVAFSNGMLDVIPPKARILDGCENLGYLAERPADFLAMYHQQKKFQDCLVAPENLAKARMQVSFAPSIWLDVYLKERKDDWALRYKPADCLQFLERNLGLVSQVSDEYVWVFTCVGKWWNIPMKPWMEKKYDLQLWEKNHPGVKDAMLRGMNPVQWFETHTHNFPNVLRNPSFSTAAPDQAQPGANVAGAAFCSLNHWSMMPEEGHWTTMQKNGKNILVASKGGLLLQNVPVKEGERYYVSTWIKTDDPLKRARLNIQWISRFTGHWDAMRNPQTPVLPGTTDADGWAHHAVVLNVPADVTHLGVILYTGMWNQKQFHDCRFKNTEVIRLFQDPGK